MQHATIRHHPPPSANARGTTMKTHRKIAIVVGILFIAATILSLLGSTLIGSVIGSPLTGTATGAPLDLANVSTHGSQLTIGALLELAAAIAVMLIPAMLFSILKHYQEGIALGYFGFRILEAITLILGAVSALLLVTLGQDYVHAGAPAVSDYQTLGVVVLGARGWAFPLDPLVFGPGALLLYALLYMANLIPRWLSAWGLIGAALVFVVGLFGMFGTLLLYLAIPIGVQEMVMALWLIVKGFNPTAIAAGSPEEVNSSRIVAA
jgi:Domain of unknown function (DUF4386)